VVQLLVLNLKRTGPAIGLNGSKSIDEVDVYTMGDHPFYATNTDSTSGQTLSCPHGSVFC